MASKTQKGVEELLSYTIITDKGKIVDVLKKHGVKISAMPSDAEVTTAVLVANKRSKAFRKDLASVLGDTLPKVGKGFMNIVGNDQDFGFTGVDDVTYMKWTGVDDFNNFTGWDDWKGIIDPIIDPNTFAKIQQAAQGAAKAQKDAQAKKTKAGMALASLWNFTKQNVLTKDNINAGIKASLNKINTDTTAKQVSLQEKSLELQKQQKDLQDNPNVPAKVGLSTTTWLLIGGGVLAVVLIGVMAFKKK